MLLLKHLISTAFRAFFRMLIVGVGAAAIAGGIVLLVAYENGHQWPPNQLTDAAAIVVALLMGYASALTVLVREAVRGVKDMERDIAGAVEAGKELAREKAQV